MDKLTNTCKDTRTLNWLLGQCIDWLQGNDYVEYKDRMMTGYKDMTGTEYTGTTIML
jgi:hypothetical protein